MTTKHLRPTLAALAGAAALAAFTGCLTDATDPAATAAASDPAATAAATDPAANASVETGARLPSLDDATPPTSTSNATLYDKVGAGACNQVGYHGGHVLDHVKIQNIYWGSYWNGAGASLRGQIDQAWRVIGNNRAFYSALEQYGSYFQIPGPGQYLGGVVNGTDPGASVNDSDVASMLQVVMAFGLVPPNTDSNMLYVVYLPAGTTSHPDQENGWGGHHGGFTRYANGLPVYFATITPMTSIDSLTLIASHEIDEAVADPAPSGPGAQGWDEVGDPCQNLNPRGYRFNGYLLERLWSANDCGCVTTTAKPFNSRHDIVWRDTTTGDVGLWQMNGSGSVRTYATLASAIPSQWQIVGTGDFDGDGEGDLLWRNTSTQQISSWLLRGTSITSWNGIPWVPTVSGSTIAGVGDFDGDGISDLLWRDGATGKVTIGWVGAHFNNPAAPTFDVPGNWEIEAIGDFDGDHTSDILWRDLNTDDIGIWLMASNGTVRSYEYPGRGIDYEWQIVDTGDFDGDGKSDILWRNLSTGEVGLWIMNGGAVTSYPIVSTVPWAWQIRSVGDLDGDGKDDIIWSQTSTGDVGAWLMNGGTARTMDTPARAIPLEWQIVRGTTADQT